MRKILKALGILAFAAVLTVLPGCNAGVGAIVAILLLDDDDDGGSGKSGATGGPATAEFGGVENARTSPQEAVIRMTLTNSDAVPALLKVEHRELAIGGGDFQPGTLIPPLPGQLVEPGTLADVPTSAAGTLNRIGWNALKDLLGDIQPSAAQTGSTQKRVRLRFSGDLVEPIEATVIIGNDPPEIVSAEFSQEPGEDVMINVVLADSASDPVDVLVAYSTDPPDTENPQFFLATTRGPTRMLTTSLTGEPHTFYWRATEDVGRVDRPAEILLLPVDTVEDNVTGKEGEEIRQRLQLDNNVAPEADFEADDFVSDPDTRGGVAMRFQIHDREQNPVDALIQWTRLGEDFPPLPETLDEDAAAREALLSDPEARRLLRIVTLTPETLNGPAETSELLELADDSVLATWLKSRHELRGIVNKHFLVGSRVEVISPDGANRQSRRVCEYDGEFGVLFVDESFDPVPEPNSLIRIEISSPLYLSSSKDGVPHRFVWDTSTDIPGGGEVNLRITPFDHAATATDDDVCGLVVKTDDPQVSRGARGTFGESTSAKGLDGPFRADDAQTIDMASIDQPVAVTAADLDNDGRLDVIYSARGSDAIDAKLQTKPGRYDDLRLLDARLTTISGLVVSDLDGNGLRDLATSSEGSSTVLIIFQLEGNDFFTERTALTADTLTTPGDLDSADFNGDGSPDIAVLNTTSDATGVVVFLRAGGAAPGTECAAEKDGYVACTYSAPQGTGSLVTIAVSDLNTDGSPDLISASDGSITRFLNSGTGSFEDAVTIPVPGVSLVDLVGADVNADGLPDVVGVDRDAGSVLALLQEDGGGFNEEPRVLQSGLAAPVALSAADFDGNGVVDFAVTDFGDVETNTSGNVRALLGDATQQYSSSALARTLDDPQDRVHPSAVTIADIDANGTLDIVSTEPQTASSEPVTGATAIYSMAGPGSFREPAQTISLDAPEASSASQPAAIFAADIDRNGHTDLITANPDGNEMVLLNQTSAAVFEPTRIPFPEGTTAESPMAIAVGAVDVNEDADVTTANVDSGSVTLFLQNEEGDLEASKDLKSDALQGPQAVQLGDMDGNGRLDIVAAGRFSDTVVVFLSGVNGGFTQTRELGIEQLPPETAFERPIALALVDLDGDGKLDIASANQISENVTVFVQEGEATVIPLGEGNRPVAVAAGDVDRNGKLDLLTANTAGQPAQIALQGDQGFTVTSLLPIDADREATGIATGDFNRDGKLDVAVSFAGDAPPVLRILLQAEQADFSDAQAFDVESASMDAPVGILAVDLDGDGALDLVSPNRQSRNVSVFYGGR